MKIKVLKEAGYEESLYAMSLSYFDEQSDVGAWWESQKEKAIKRSAKMAHQHGGHNDFLSLTAVWVEIQAPLYLWKQLDRYQVGFRKLSTSTMHTLKKTGVSIDRFEEPPLFFDIEKFNEWLVNDNPSIDEVANELPDGFIQRRVALTNYMTLRNIIFQRNNHKLKLWKQFCDAIYEQVDHPEFLPILDTK